MDSLTIRYDLPIGFDTATIVHYPHVGIMEWCDIFDERDQWKTLAKDALTLLVRSERLSAAEKTYVNRLFARMEKLK